MPLFEVEGAYSHACHERTCLAITVTLMTEPFMVTHQQRPTNLQGKSFAAATRDVGAYDGASFAINHHGTRMIAI
jgi:hypothetical protein